MDAWPREGISSAHAVGICGVQAIAKVVRKLYELREWKLRVSAVSRGWAVACQVGSCTSCESGSCE